MTMFLALDLAPVTHAAWRDPAGGGIVGRACLLTRSGNLGSQAVELAKSIVSTFLEVRPTHVSISPAAAPHLRAVAVAEIERYGAQVVEVRGSDAATLLLTLERRVVSEQRCASFKAQARAYVGSIVSRAAVAA